MDESQAVGSIQEVVDPSAGCTKDATGSKLTTVNSKHDLTPVFWEPCLSLSAFTIGQHCGN